MIGGLGGSIYEADLEKYISSEHNGCHLYRVSI